MSAAWRAIAATDFASDDRGSQRVFGAPIGRIHDVGGEQEGKHGRKFDGEMGGKLLRDTLSPRTVDEGVELVLQVPAGDGDAVRRDGALKIPVADAQGVLQDPLDARRKAALVVVADQEATAPQQVSETALVKRGRKSPIRRPAVADEDRVEVRAQHGGRVESRRPSCPV